MSALLANRIITPICLAAYLSVALLGGGGLVWCVGPGGHQAIEAAHASHTGGADAAMPPLSVAVAEHEPQHGCTDTPVSGATVTSSRHDGGCSGKFLAILPPTNLAEVIHYQSASSHPLAIVAGPVVAATRLQTLRTVLLLI